VKTNLLRAREVRQALSSYRDDALHDLTEVAGDVVHVERSVGLFSVPSNAVLAGGWMDRWMSDVRRLSGRRLVGLCEQGRLAQRVEEI